MWEAACEPSHRCDTDQLAFKGFLSRFMTYASQVAPFIAKQVNTHLKTSAPAAAKSCSGGKDNVTCGTTWVNETWDGTYGVGQQLSALETIQNLLVFMDHEHYHPPYNKTDGGNSTGNPASGTQQPVVQSHP